MTGGEILAAAIGFLVGMAVMAIGVWKTVASGWDDAYKTGFQDGAEIIEVVMANERKERELFGEAE